MGAPEELWILLKAKDEAKGVMRESAHEVTGYGTALDRILKPALLGVAAAAGTAIGFAQLFGKAAMENERVNAGLGQALRNIGVVFQGELPANVETFINALSNMSAFSRNEIGDALSFLIAQTEDYGEAQTRVRLATDLSRTANIDLFTASRLLGKIDEEHINALNRLGFHIRKGATEEEAFADIQKRVHDRGLAYTKTAAGQWDIVSNRVEVLRETLGKSLLPVATHVAQKVSTFLEGMIQSGAVERFSGAVRVLADAFEQGASRVGAFFSDIQSIGLGAAIGNLVNDIIARAKEQIPLIGQKLDELGPVGWLIKAVATGVVLQKLGAGVLIDALITAAPTGGLVTMGATKVAGAALQLGMTTALVMGVAGFFFATGHEDYARAFEAAAVPYIAFEGAKMALAARTVAGGAAGGVVGGFILAITAGIVLGLILDAVLGDKIETQLKKFWSDDGWWKQITGIGAIGIAAAGIAAGLAWPLTAALVFSFVLGSIVFGKDISDGIRSWWYQLESIVDQKAKDFAQWWNTTVKGLPGIGGMLPTANVPVLNIGGGGPAGGYQATTIVGSNIVGSGALTVGGQVPFGYDYIASGGGSAIFRNEAGDIIRRAILSGGGTPADYPGPTIQAAEGGIFPARAGGYMVNLAEGGKDEAVIPLDRMGGAGGTVELHIHVNGSVFGINEVSDEIRRVVRDTFLNGGFNGVRAA